MIEEESDAERVKRACAAILGVLRTNEPVLRQVVMEMAGNATLTDDQLAADASVSCYSAIGAFEKLEKYILANEESVTVVQGVTSGSNVSDKAFGRGKKSPTARELARSSRRIITNV